MADRPTGEGNWTFEGHLSVRHVHHSVILEFLSPSGDPLLVGELTPAEAKRLSQVLANQAAWANRLYVEITGIEP